MGRRRIVVAVLVALIALVGVVVLRLFVWPSTDAVRHVDAVVLFAGGRGERLALAERLMGDGVATHLVVPNGTAPEWPQGNRACTEARSYEVHCPKPTPDTTRGEARAIARLAEAEGWDEVLVVTSTYQVARASLLLDRCFDGSVLTAKANPHLGPIAAATRIGHEAVAWAWSVTGDRSC